ATRAESVERLRDTAADIESDHWSLVGRAAPDCRVEAVDDDEGRVVRLRGEVGHASAMGAREVAGGPVVHKAEQDWVDRLARVRGIDGEVAPLEVEGEEVREPGPARIAGVEATG